MGRVKDGWYRCRCGAKLFPVRPDAVLINHSAYCKKCQEAQVVTIALRQLVAEERPRGSDQLNDN